MNDQLAIDRKVVKIKAWIQMGTERRETVIEVPPDVFERGLHPSRHEPYAEGRLEAYVLDWLWFQFGWGWSGGGHENDFGFMEGFDSGHLHATTISSIPNTVALRVQPRFSENPLGEQQVLNFD